MPAAFPITSPEASPVTSPGPFNLLGGTRPATSALAWGAGSCCYGVRCYTMVEQAMAWVWWREPDQEGDSEAGMAGLATRCDGADCDYTCRLDCIG